MLAFETQELCKVGFRSLEMVLRPAWFSLFSFEDWCRRVGVDYAPPTSG